MHSVGYSVGQLINAPASNDQERLSVVSQTAGKVKAVSTSKTSPLGFRLQSGG